MGLLTPFYKLALACRLKHLGRGVDIATTARFEYAHRIVLADQARIAHQTLLRANSESMLTIGEGTSILEFCLLTANQGSITLGNNSWLGAGSQIYGNGHVVVGNDVLIAPQCILNTVSHHYMDTERPINHQGIHVAPIYIDDDVWIGLGVKVLQGVHIGHGAVIGAGSLVTSDIPAFAVAFGSPARVRSWRSREVETS